MGLFSGRLPSLPPSRILLCRNKLMMVPSGAGRLLVERARRACYCLRLRVTSGAPVLVPSDIPSRRERGLFHGGSERAVSSKRMASDRVDFGQNGSPERGIGRCIRPHPSRRLPIRFSRCCPTKRKRCLVSTALLERALTHIHKTFYKPAVVAGPG